MKPADAYITDFIKDINRSRVIELRSIMDPKSKGTGTGLSHKMSVEDALPLLNAAKSKSFAVVDEEKKNIGSVTLDSAIHALARREDSAVSERYK